MTLSLELGGIRDPQIQRALQILAQQFPVVATGGGGGGAPTGIAGGDLGSTYPNPTVVKAQSGFTVGGVAIVLSTDASVTNARTPTAHHATHEPGGTDAMAVDAVAATGSLRTLGTGAAQAAAGNDSRLSDARTPTAHTHPAADIVSGVLATGRLGSGTPAAGTYVDGGTGAWTTLPAGGGGAAPSFVNQAKWYSD